MIKIIFTKEDVESILREKGLDEALANKIIANEDFKEQCSNFEESSIEYGNEFISGFIDDFVEEGGGVDEILQDLPD